MTNDDLLPAINRAYLAARLDGYLDAVASIDGAFRDVRMSAALIDLEGMIPEVAVANQLAKWARPAQLLSFSSGHDWIEAERLLNRLFLFQPFGKESLGDCESVIATRFELAFQATDMIMFLAADHAPRGLCHYTMTNEHMISGVGCAIRYEGDLLVINHVRWRRPDAQQLAPGNALVTSQP